MDRFPNHKTYQLYVKCRCHLFIHLFSKHFGVFAGCQMWWLGCPEGSCDPIR